MWSLDLRRGQLSKFSARCRSSRTMSAPPRVEERRLPTQVLTGRPSPRQPHDCLELTVVHGHHQGDAQRGPRSVSNTVFAASSRVPAPGPPVRAGVSDVVCPLGPALFGGCQVHGQLVASAESSPMPEPSSAPEQRWRRSPREGAASGRGLEPERGWNAPGWSELVEVETVWGVRRQEPCSVHRAGRKRSACSSRRSHTSLRLLRNLGLVTGTRAGQRIVYGPATTTTSPCCSIRPIYHTEHLRLGLREPRHRVAQRPAQSNRRRDRPRSPLIPAHRPVAPIPLQWGHDFSPMGPRRG